RITRIGTKEKAARLFVAIRVIRGSLGIELQSPPFDFALQNARSHAERRSGALHVTAGFLQRLANLVLELPFLHVAVERSLSDAQHPGRFLPIALSQLKRLLDVVTLDFHEWPAHEGPWAGGLVIGKRQPAQRVTLLQIIETQDSIRILHYQALD